METNQTYQNELGSAMLPFVMRELVDTVMKRKTLPLEDALYYIFLQFVQGIIGREYKTVVFKHIITL